MFKKPNNNCINDVKSLNDEYLQRKKKLVELRNNKFSFPNNFFREFTTSQLHEKFDCKNHEDLKKINLNIKVSGRIITKRIMGKASFVTLQDSMGSRIQLYISLNYLNKKSQYDQFKNWDLGDIIGTEGYLFKTKTEELSIYCKKIILLVKTLRQLPDKFYGLNNKEICYRKRYLDLIVNNNSIKKFVLRSKIIKEIRNFMNNNDFLEVETPMLHKIPSGALAKPFITHHNKLNDNMYLRISPELYLKQLVIGGFEKVFEINRNFRNEGISPYHNPEFTMMELYIAYANYKNLMQFIEKLFLYVSKKVLETTIIYYKDKKINFLESFKVLTMKKAIIKYKPQIKEKDLNNYSKVIEIANYFNIAIQKNWKIGQIILEIFEKEIKHLLLKPTFITEYPIEVSPLARRNDKDINIADRFELFIGGYEIGNGFSELNDSEDQLNRFIKQKKNNKYDKEYITALEHGLPPTAGLGIGIDRMVMILTNSSNIRDIILFPTLKNSST